MLFYEVKIKYDSQTGGDAPRTNSHVYLIEGLNMTDVETKLMEEVTPLMFGGESEIQSCRKAQFYDIFTDPNKEKNYKARVEMITIDGDKEVRKAVNVLVQADTVEEAAITLRLKLTNTDCEIISIARSPIEEILR